MAGKLLKYLPKPTSFSIPSTATHRPAFSGPINISIVPKDARRTKNNQDSSSYPDEPTSPKVSCIGQVKNKHKKKIKKAKEKAKKIPEPDEEKEEKKTRKPLRMQSLFSRKVRSESAAETTAPAVAPGIGTMRRFRSGRESLGDFDWRAEADQDEVLVPHSAPILIGGGGVVAVERKKEVNLWKRRTLSPPKSLEV